MTLKWLMLMQFAIVSAIPVPPQIEVVELAGGAFSVSGTLDLGAAVTVEAAWRVLTDYSHLARFVPGMKESQVRMLSDRHALVEQEVRVQVFIFTHDVRLVLAISEIPEQSISFHDISGDDFERYDGSWELTQSLRGLVIHYQLVAKSRISVPAAVARRVIERDAGALLGSLAAEMGRVQSALMLVPGGGARSRSTLDGGSSTDPRVP